MSTKYLLMKVSERKKIENLEFRKKYPPLSATVAGVFFLDLTKVASFHWIKLVLKSIQGYRVACIPVLMDSHLNPTWNIFSPGNIPQVQTINRMPHDR